MLQGHVSSSYEMRRAMWTWFIYPVVVVISLVTGKSRQRWFGLVEHTHATEWKR